MAKRAVKFAEHLYDNVLEDVPHRHIIFTIPKRLRSYFRYDRALNRILFDTAWGAITEVLGANDAVPTLQTAGEALNHRPHLHGCALATQGFIKVRYLFCPICHRTFLSPLNLLLRIGSPSK